MIESFKRYYNNSFLDGQRQEAYNLFLGNYIFAQGQPMLWDLATDYYLHHEDPRTWLQKSKRDYIHWYTPEFLQQRVLDAYPCPKGAVTSKSVAAYDDYWLEYYRPSTLSSFPKMFPYKMNSTIKYIPFKATQDGRYDLSPFRVRNDGDGEAHERKKAAKKEVTIFAPHDLSRTADDAETSSINEKPPTPTLAGTATSSSTGRSLSLRWLQQGPNDKQPNGLPHNNHHHHTHHRHPSIMKDPSHHHTHSRNHSHSYPGTADDPSRSQTALEKSHAAQWTFTQVVHSSLNPSVTPAEADDYARYVSHPHNLPLVTSTETPASDVVEPEYMEYVNGRWRDEGLSEKPQVGGAGMNRKGWEGGEGDDEEAGEDEMGGDRALYVETVRVADNVLTVTEEDAVKKRYKAYRKWLRGKSLFKQQPVD
jgi:hypothetical protein